MVLLYMNVCTIEMYAQTGEPGNAIGIGTGMNGERTVGTIGAVMKAEAMVMNVADGK
jgi:hypothetical protein